MQWGWISSTPGLDTVGKQQQPITIDGKQGTMADLSVAPTWTSDCVSLATQTFANGDHYILSIARNERMRLIMVPLVPPNGPWVGIAIDATDGSGFDAFVAQAMPIVQSFAFFP